ncbi:MAG: hypothetical protein GY711_33835 [bacterium]|nr:hypothetical protein [bacterium]
MVAVLSAMGSITASAVLGESTRETTLAYQAATRVIERLQGTPCEDVFALYNSVTSDDPADGAPGADFAVEGLSAQDGDRDGMAGEVLLPVSSRFPWMLLEVLHDNDFGMPRDLNADGVVGFGDRSGDYTVLPVRVRIAWTGLSGDRAIEVETVLAVR